MFAETISHVHRPVLFADLHFPRVFISVLVSCKKFRTVVAEFDICQRVSASTGGRVSPAEQCCSFSRSLMAAARCLNYSQIRSNQPSGAGDVCPFRAFKLVLAHCRIQLAFISLRCVHPTLVFAEHWPRLPTALRDGIARLTKFHLA